MTKQFTTKDITIDIKYNSEEDLNNSIELAQIENNLSINDDYYC